MTQGPRALSLHNGPVSARDRHKPCVLGIDGCRRGWFAVRLEAHTGWSMELLDDDRALGDAVEDVDLALIDIPIGLLDGGREERGCDRAARRRLGRPRAASVFRPPARPALVAGDYPQANAANRAATGVGLSRQGFGIAPKIREVDELLCDRPALRARLRESHPEVCFQALNSGRAMDHNKKTAAGRSERRAVLSAHMASAEAIIESSLARFRRADVAHDDILDALVLAAAADLGTRDPRHLLCLPERPPKDTRGLAMEIVYAEP